MANYVEQLDHYIADLLSEWNIYSTVLAVIITVLVLYPIFFVEEPDTHPLLLARQAIASPVRKRYESAVYRALETPPGTPLKTGLDVKDHNTPRWAPGRDGDLADVWREVLRAGTTNTEGRLIPSGKIMTVLGKEEVVEHGVQQMSKEIKILGQHMKDKGCKKVAIYLPNSVEYLMTIFACSFYGVSTVLLPYNLPHPKVYELLDECGADGLISAAGTLPLEDLSKACTNLKLLTWVVEKTSRHMDWNGVPDFAAKRLHVSVWHDLVEDSQASTTTELPVYDKATTSHLYCIWQPVPLAKKPEIVAFTQANLAAGLIGLITSLPVRSRFSETDLVVPASSFHVNYVLCQTLVALYSHASVAITSVAEPGVDFDAAMRGIAPTVIIASAETLARLHEKRKAQQVSLPLLLDKYLRKQSLSAGRLAAQNMFLRLLAKPHRPGNLRLIFVAERLGTGTPPLSSRLLSDLRLHLHTRICYALTTARVAGAVAQTNLFDYRDDDVRGHSHFGVPLSGLEIKLTSEDDTALSVPQPEGELTVTGPAVSGNEVHLGVKVRIRGDATLAYGR